MTDMSPGCPVANVARTLMALPGLSRREGIPSMGNGPFAGLSVEECRGIDPRAAFPCSSFLRMTFLRMTFLRASFLRMADGPDVCHVREVSRVGASLGGVVVCPSGHGRGDVTPFPEGRARRAARGGRFMDLFARNLQWRLL